MHFFSFPGKFLPFSLLLVVIKGTSGQILSRNEWVEMCKDGVKLSQSGANESEVTDVLVKQLLDKSLDQKQRSLTNRFGSFSVCGYNRNPYCGTGLFDNVYVLWKQLAWMVYQEPQSIFTAGISPIVAAIQPSFTPVSDPQTYLNPVTSLGPVGLIQYPEQEYSLHRPLKEPNNYAPTHPGWLYGQSGFYSSVYHYSQDFQNRHNQGDLMKGCERLSFLPDLDLSQLDNVGLFIRNVVIKTGLHLPQSFINKISKFFNPNYNISNPEESEESLEEEDSSLGLGDPFATEVPKYLDENVNSTVLESIEGENVTSSAPTQLNESQL